MGDFDFCSDCATISTVSSFSHIQLWLKPSEFFISEIPAYIPTIICEEDAGIRINDGATRVFYNCSYKGDDVPEDIRELYCYIETGTCSNDLTERIEGAVAAARMNEEWRSAYMKEITVLMDAREEGREEGRREERKRTEAERKRADDAEAVIARYREKYGELPVL